MIGGSISSLLIEKFHVDILEGVFIWMHVLPFIMVFVFLAMVFQGKQEGRLPVRLALLASFCVLGIIEYILLRYFNANILGLLRSADANFAMMNLRSIISFAVVGLIFFSASFMAWACWTLICLLRSAGKKGG